MEQIQINAPAKINLSLDIVGTRQDGYHLMQMVMQTVNLADSITLKKNDTDSIILSCDKHYIPLDKTNIAHKAAIAFFADTKLCAGVCIELQKNIPTGAGMGGGSADGAGVLVGLNQLFETDLSMDQLIAIGQAVGADIPFCLVGGTALVEGIGERVTSLTPMPSCHIVVVKPRISVNTKRAFADYDKATITNRPNTQQLLDAVDSHDLIAITKQLCNVFEQTVQLKQLPTLKTLFLKHGALNALLTGSGSAVYGVFTQESKAKSCLAELKKEGYESFLCETFSQGPCIF